MKEKLNINLDELLSEVSKKKEMENQFSPENLITDGLNQEFQYHIDKVKLYLNNDKNQEISKFTQDVFYMWLAIAYKDQISYDKDSLDCLDSFENKKNELNNFIINAKKEEKKQEKLFNRKETLIFLSKILGLIFSLSLLNSVIYYLAVFILQSTLGTLVMLPTIFMISIFVFIKFVIHNHKELKWKIFRKQYLEKNNIKYLHIAKEKALAVEAISNFVKNKKYPFIGVNLAQFYIFSDLYQNKELKEERIKWILENPSLTKNYSVGEFFNNDKVLNHLNCIRDKFVKNYENFKTRMLNEKISTEFKDFFI